MLLQGERRKAAVDRKSRAERPGLFAECEGYKQQEVKTKEEKYAMVHLAVTTERVGRYTP